MFRSLIRKTGIDKDEIQYLAVGCVIQEPKTTNVAREVALTAGLPMQIPAHTVTQACISANQAITTTMAYIASGLCDVAIAGGVEYLSDVPIRVSRAMRKLLLSLNSAKTATARLALIAKLRPSFLSLEVSL